MSTRLYMKDCTSTSSQVASQVCRWHASLWTVKLFMLKLRWTPYEKSVSVFVLCFYYQETLFKDTERDSDSNCSGAGHVPTLHEWPGQATSIVKWASHAVSVGGWTKHILKMRAWSFGWWMLPGWFVSIAQFLLVRILCSHWCRPFVQRCFVSVFTVTCLFISLCLSLSNRSPSRQTPTFFSILSIRLYFLPMSQKIAIISGFHIWQKGSEMACAHGLHRSWCWSHPAVMAPGH